MPKGLTPTSEQIVVSFGLSEDNPNSINQERIDLQLNALDSEVFVVTGVKLDIDPCDVVINVAGIPTRTASFACLSKQDISASALGIVLANPSVFATASTIFQNDLAATATNDVSASYLYIENSVDTPSQLEYVDIIATPDFFVTIAGSGNNDAKGVQGKLYGYRAKASAATYASLVQSELLSQ